MRPEASSLNMRSFESLDDEQVSTHFGRRILEMTELISYLVRLASRKARSGSLTVAVNPDRRIGAISAAMDETSTHSNALVANYRNFRDVIAQGVVVRRVIPDFSEERGVHCPRTEPT